MDMHYPRTGSQRKGDHAGARLFEEEVGTWLGDFKIGNLDATDRMDWWVPGVYIDVKEKNQPLSARWPLPPGTMAEDVFILDELSIRRAMEKFPHAYFVMHDRPRGGVYLARIDEVIAGQHVRVNRVGSTGKAKGKWLVDLREFRKLDDPANQLLAMVLGDQIAMPWKKSELLMRGAD
jgi:hypothetical protein